MDQHGPHGDDRYNPGSRGESRRRRPLLLPWEWPVYVLIVVLAGAIAGGVMYAFMESQHRRDLEAANQRLSASLARVQTQLQSVDERISDLLARPAQPPAPAPARAPSKARAPLFGQTRDDSRLGQIQSQLSEQGRQLASARADIDKAKSTLNETRDDLQNNISSTKNELNGSIARTHEEVVALQRRGERNYYEFAVDKSKHYSRVGPLSIELRNADTKHKRFDMMMLVEDNELQKKNVNLYETVWINISDRPQPMELVVNKVAKDHVEGYLSEPKYKKSELESLVAVKPATVPQ